MRKMILEKIPRCDQYNDTAATEPKKSFTKNTNYNINDHKCDKCEYSTSGLKKFNNHMKVLHDTKCEQCDLLY